MLNYFNSHFNFFVFDGKPSTDFGVMVFSHGAYSDPEPNESETKIPGMNGVLHFWDGSFSEITETYSVMVKGSNVVDIREKVERLRAWLLSKRRYCRLEDTLHPDYYRMGIYKGKSPVEYSGNEQMGKLEIEFKCKPQKFLKSGELPIEASNGAVIYNGTEFASKPLIRVYGTSGSINVGGVSVSINGISGHADIDCDLEEVAGYNDKTTLVNGKFPVLNPGQTNISFSGFSKVDVYPRWWTL